MTYSKLTKDERIADLEVSKEFIRKLEEILQLKSARIADQIGVSKQYYSLIRTGVQTITVSFLKRCKSTFNDDKISELCRETASQLLAS